MRPEIDTIHAPPFPRGLDWIGTAALRIDKQLGRPLVIGFWDRNVGASITAMQTLEQWHRAYAPRGARIIAVHVSGTGESAAVDAVADTAERHGLTMPIVLDDELQIAEAFGVVGVPSRYIFDQALKLADAHFGVGAVADGEQVLAALVEHGERALAARSEQVEAATPQEAEDPEEKCDQGADVPPAKQPRLMVRPPAPSELPDPIDDPRPFVPPAPHERVAGDSRGPYEAGRVWLELRGTGRVLPAGGEPIVIERDGTYPLQGDGSHHAGVVDFTLEGELWCDAIELEPGTSPAQ